MDLHMREYILGLVIVDLLKQYHKISLPCSYIGILRETRLMFEVTYERLLPGIREHFSLGKEVPMKSDLRLFIMISRSYLHLWWKEWYQSLSNMVNKVYLRFLLKRLRSFGIW